MLRRQMILKTGLQRAIIAVFTRGNDEVGRTKRFSQASDRGSISQ